jgi:hypothetical protein
MAKVAYCFIEDGQLLLGVDDSGSGEKVKHLRLAIDRNMLELMEGAVSEARIDFDERQATAPLPMARSA